MFEYEEEDSIEELDEDDLEEDEEDDDPSDVFVGMAFGRDGCDVAFAAIESVCESLGLTARRAHQNHVVGSPTIDEVVQGMLDEADFAIFDLTHQRPSVAHEIGFADGVFDRAFILLIAKKGTPRFANIESRIVHEYADEKGLRLIVKRQMKEMIEVWHESESDDEQ